MEKRLSSIENWHERSQCNPWCGEPECLHIDSLGGYPDLRHRTDAMIQARADSLGRIILAAVLMLLLWYGFAHAHMGACVPSEVGYNVTVCDPQNRTKCVPTAALASAQKVGWIIGRCQGEPPPCAPGTCPVNYTVCCQYPGHTETAGSVEECPKTIAGSCLTGVAEAAEADPAGTTCVPAGTAKGTNSPLAFPSSEGMVPRFRIMGSTDIPLNCTVSNTVACCKYIDAILGIVTTTADGTVSDCPLTLPGGQIFAGGDNNSYSSGDGLSCVSNGN